QSGRLFSSALLAFDGGVALVHPVGPEVIRDVEYLHVCEARFVQLVVRRPHIGTMAPRAAPAIKNDERFAGQWLSPPSQRFDALRIRTGPDVLGTGNMRLH